MSGFGGSGESSSSQTSLSQTFGNIGANADTIALIALVVVALLAFVFISKK